MSMQQALDELKVMSARLAAVRRPGWGKTASRLDIDAGADGIHVHWLLNRDAEFEPDIDASIFGDIYLILGSNRIAPWLARLTLEGHQIARNGTIDWKIEPLASAKVKFERLKVLRIESLGSPKHGPYTNGTLEGWQSNDSGLVTRLLERMPVLEKLAIPEAPKHPSFFDEPVHPLRRLSVCNTDYDSFISRLAQSSRFPRLECAVFAESVRTDTEPRLPATDYASLFQSAAFPGLQSITLRNADLDDDRISRLRGTRIGRQLCQLEIKPAESWCDRPILRAPDCSARFANICGEPFRLPNWKSRWRSADSIAIARGMRQSGDFSAFPILADALEEAGCDNAEILLHCRSSDKHLPGCWVLEPLIRKVKSA